MKHLLVDNGSLRADSVLNLRRIARLLSEREGIEVFPSSLLHSGRIPAGELGNEPAVNLEKRLRIWLEAGERAFTILPFFFGPTGAIVDYLPKRISVLREKYGDFAVQRTPFLFDQSDGSNNHQLVKILADNVRQSMRDQCLVEPRVALVDHGSPLPTVTDVRNRLAVLLERELDGEVRMVAPASMERRPGREYAFNEPLLEKLLLKDGWKESTVVISMLFLSPGRHAGPEGDVAAICAGARAGAPRLVTHMTGLVGTHPGIVGLLASRLKDRRLPVE